jgi:hypothetical protein
MHERIPISSPGKYISPTAVGFSTGRGDFAIVTPDAPLPVTIASSASKEAPPKPLMGEATASTIVGPFVPTSDTPMHLQISGAWKGTVVLERSVDGGKTRQGVTAGGLPWARFSGNVNEPVWQESGNDASLWLNITLDSGKLSYRLSQ